MSTSEYRSVDAEGDLPISAPELAALATQLFAASIRPGPDSPPQTTPVAPRGTVPDATAATSAGAAAAGAANPFTPAQFTPAPDVYVPAPTSPAPEGIPQTVPVAPRGNAPDATAAPSAGIHRGKRTRSVRGAVLGPGVRRCPECWPAPRPRFPWRRAGRHPAGRPGPRRSSTWAGRTPLPQRPRATRPTTTFSPRRRRPRRRSRRHDFPTTTRCSTSTRYGRTSRSCARPSTASH